MHILSKIKRNEPCPCGSGKKYKKCCGASPVTEPESTVINDELERLHHELNSFAMNKYGDDINEQTKLYNNPILQNNEETLNVYNVGLTIWILFNAPFIENNQTIFDVFYNNNKSRMSQLTRHMLSEWPKKAPSVYEVMSVDRQTKQFVTVKDILTNDSYPIPFHEEDDFIEGSVIIGTLVPFIDYHSFLFTMIKLYRHDKDTLTQLLQQYSAEDGGLQKHFPDFLAHALVDGVKANEWDNPLYEEVVQLFAKHMVDKDYADDIILKGFTLWNTYCKKEKPSFKNIESYAAALEYLVQKKLPNMTTVTQSQLAKEYNTSPGTVSTNFRKLSNALEKGEN